MTDYKLMPKSIVDELAQFIRQVDGNNKMGAGSLAEKICERFHVADPAVQGETIGFCEDAALSLAERTFSTEVDEQLAEDVIRYARRLHDLYAAPQPAPDVTGLVEALEAALMVMTSKEVRLEKQADAITMARAALAAHRKQGGEV